MIKKIILFKIILIVFLLGSLPAKADDYYPMYPTRLRDIMAELSESSQNLISLNKDLTDMADSCNCKNVASQCERDGLISTESSDPEAIGEICPQRNDMENVQQEITSQTDNVAYLRNLLITEMNSGLEEELKTLRADEAKVLRDELNKILASSQKLISTSQKNSKILNDEDYSAENKCKASCNQGALGFELKACAFGGAGVQNPIKLTFEVGAGLTDINLGDVNIAEVNLNLPDKIQFLKASKIPDLEIPLPQLSIEGQQILLKDIDLFSFPSIVFHSSSLSLPDFPQAGFSCPSSSNSKSYQCDPSAKEKNSSYITFNWYLATISWLSGQCQGIPGMVDGDGVPTEKINKCLDKENVYLTILEECDSAWKKYLLCPTCTPLIKMEGTICESLKQESQRNEAIERECKSLFNQGNEPAPSNCNLTALKNECSRLEQSGDVGEIPEECRYLPLFTKTIKVPETQSYQSSSSSCPSQTIYSNSNSSGCLSAGAGGTAKIDLPDIIIPDMELQDFEFMPFIKVNLPSFIFEDLVFPEMDLCDINSCNFSSTGSFLLDIQSPVLKIPSIKIPAIYANIPGLSVPKKIKIELDNIDFPAIPISLPKFDLADYISLKMNMPEIEMPGIEFYANFSGIDFNAINFLLGLISQFVSIPGGCISLGGSANIPLIIGFPDYYFYWPRFPEFPNLCQGIDDFCRKTKNSLGLGFSNGVLQKLQDTINKTIQNNVQSYLDQVSLVYQKAIENAVSNRLGEIKADIEAGYSKAMAGAVVENGYLKIPGFSLPRKSITVSMSGVNNLLAGMPGEVAIQWPAELKSIKLANPISYALPKIPLNGLNYSKEITIKIPGFQSPAALTLSFMAQFIDYNSSTPSGGNPYPTNTFRININETKGISDEINNSVNAINEVLR